MLFMVIERFKDNSNTHSAYEHVKTNGRDLPVGLDFVNSWIEPGSAEFVQLMECKDQKLLQQWVLNWRGTEASVEIVPVL